MATETLFLSSLAPEAAEVTSVSQCCCKASENTDLPKAMSRLVLKSCCVPTVLTVLGKE